MPTENEINTEFTDTWQRKEYSRYTYSYRFDSAKIDKLMVYGKDSAFAVANKIHIYQHNPGNIAFINLCAQNKIKFTNTFENVTIFATNEINIKELLILAEIPTSAAIDICQVLGMKFEIPTLQEHCIKKMMLEMDYETPKIYPTWKRNHLNRLERCLSNEEKLSILRNAYVDSTGRGIYVAVAKISDNFESFQEIKPLKPRGENIAPSLKRKACDGNDNHHLDTLKESRKREANYNKFASYL